MARSVVLAFTCALSLIFAVGPALPLLAAGVPSLATPLGMTARAPYFAGAGAPFDPSAAGVAFTLLKDEVDPTGRWVQTFRMVIKPGGTLAEASELLYGNIDHVEELFTAIKRQHPGMTSPSRVQANTATEIALDPHIAFVPKEVATDPRRGATITTYHNGARRIDYDPNLASDRKGLSSILELPGDRPATKFAILEDYVVREVPAGVRIAYYEFQATDNFKQVVAEVYGVDSINAAHDFLNQTRWDPNRWPPAPNERRQRLVVPMAASFEDERFVPLDVTAGNPASGDLLKAQMAERASAGIFALRRQPYGTVYRVIATDFNLTARQVSTLLYGDDSEYLAVAAQSGFASLYELLQDPPEDVRLFGRSFEVLVDYEREQFPARPPTVDRASGKRTTLLLNGTIIEEWPVEPDKSGLLRQITLPSGYHKVLYRPNSITAMASQILYAMVTLGRGSGNPEVRQQDEGRFVSRLIWDWGREFPKPAGEVLDYGRLILIPVPETEKVDQQIEFASRPALRDGLGAPPFYRAWVDNPLAVGVAAVFAAVITLGVFNWLARRV